MCEGEQLGERGKHEAGCTGQLAILVMREMSASRYRAAVIDQASYHAYGAATIPTRHEKWYEKRKVKGRCENRLGPPTAGPCRRYATIGSHGTLNPILVRGCDGSIVRHCRKNPDSGLLISR